MNNYTNFTNSFTHSLLYLPNRESTVKRKINLSIPFVHDPPFCTPTRLAEKSEPVQSGLRLVSIAYWKFSREREKVWNRHIGGGERSFCSYIRRALISKSEGWCSHTVTTLHQTRSVTAKRAVRRLCSILQGVPLRYGR